MKKIENSKTFVMIEPKEYEEYLKLKSLKQKLENLQEYEEHINFMAEHLESKEKSAEPRLKELNKREQDFLMTIQYNNQQIEIFKNNIKLIEKNKLKFIYGWLKINFPILKDFKKY